MFHSTFEPRDDIDRFASENNLEELKKVYVSEADNCVLFWGGYHCNWDMIKYGLANRRTYGGLWRVLYGMAASSKYDENIVSAIMFAHRCLICYLRNNKPDYPWIDLSIYSDETMELLYEASKTYGNHVFDHVNNFDYKKEENTTLYGQLLMQSIS